MNGTWLKNCLLLTGALAVLSIIWIATGSAQKSVSEASWQQSASVSVRLGVKGKASQVEAYDALFTVYTLDYPNGRVTHEIKKRITPDQFTYLYFPEDIHARALPGKYGWTCTVGNDVVAKGEFEYTSVSRQSDQAKVLK